MRVKSIGHAATLSLVAVVGGVSGGCVIDGDGVPPAIRPDAAVAPEPVAPSTTRGHLVRARTFVVKEGGTASLVAKRLLGEDLVVPSTLPILDGELVVQAQSDGRLVLHALSLGFGDIHLEPEAVPPDGIDLMDIGVSMERCVADTRWSSDGDSASAGVDAALLLDWSLHSPAGVLPLSPHRIEDVPVTVDLVPGAGGSLTATVRAARSGVFFHWTGMIELADLELVVEAVERD